MLTPLAYAAGVVAATAILGGSAASALFAVRRLAPAASGVEALLAWVVLWVGGLILVAEALGLFGVLRTGPIAAVFAVAGALGLVGLYRAGHRLPGVSLARLRAASIATPLETWLAVVAVALVFGDWAGRALDSALGGIDTADTLRYHLPFAVEMIQRGSVAGIQRLALEPAVSFQPENGTLLNAILLLPFHRDTLVLAVNFGWLCVAICAAWSLGRTARERAGAVIGLCVLAGTPLYALANAGSADDDVMTLALFLAGVALLAARPRDRRYLALAGLAAGLAVGTKLYAVSPVVALILAVAWSQRWRRGAVNGAILAGFAVLGGGYWFARNLAVAGSPLPSVKLNAGGIGFHYVASSAVPLGYSILHYAGQARFWLVVVPFQYTPWLGRGWPVLILAAVAGVAVGLRDRGALRHGAVAALGGLVAYPFTPWTAQTLPGLPNDAALMGPNFRYATLGIALGLILLGARARWRLVAPAGLALLLSEQVALNARTQPFGSQPVVALAVFIATVGLAWLLTRRPRWVLGPATIGLAALLLLLAAYPLQNAYLRRWYARSTRPGAVAFRWARTLSDARIAVAGTELVYPLYGADLSNHVVYPAQPLGDGGWTRIPSCDAWLAALRAGGSDYAVTVNQGGDATEAAWTRRVGAATLVTDGQTTVFKLPTSLPASCGEAG